ncbi:MAG: Ig-like domain-containing protein, partial [Bacteroidales bacterium]|nr:Ig-like domain-containing protein [Bacteroidales bacterium]
KGATYNAGSAVLSGSDDSAYKVWGEHWRMPTKDELQALIDSCDVKWTNSYNDSGMAGTIYTGRGDYSFNSIFLPAAGFHSSSDGKINSKGFYGSYWSSTPAGSDKAVSLDFLSSTPQMNINRTRDYGCSVRPVYVEDIVAVTGISLDKTKLKVEGNTETLSATVAPTNATNKKVLWTSSNEGVATVDAYGKVTGVASGNCVITATTEDGKKIATCAVEVVVQTTGTAKRTGNIDVNWVQLWKDGPKFADYNVGATNNKATDYGGYYCWGKAIDKDSNGSYKEGESALSGDDDTATKLWGENWRMPTIAELQALLNNCNVELKDNYNGTAGLLCTGKGNYSSNSIFLPAPGGCGYGNVYDQGEYGCYWSSTPAPDDEDGQKRARRLGFSFVSLVAKWYVDFYPRDGGYSVRAVLAK